MLYPLSLWCKRATDSSSDATSVGSDIDKLKRYRHPVDSSLIQRCVTPMIFLGSMDQASSIDLTNWNFSMQLPSDLAPYWMTSARLYRACDYRFSSAVRKEEWGRLIRRVSGSLRFVIPLLIRKVAIFEIITFHLYSDIYSLIVVQFRKQLET